jgi:hypothetical protein
MEPNSLMSIDHSPQPDVDDARPTIRRAACGPRSSQAFVEDAVRGSTQTRVPTQLEGEIMQEDKVQEIPEAVATDEQPTVDGAEQRAPRREPSTRVMVCGSEHS